MNSLLNTRVSEIKVYDDFLDLLRNLQERKIDYSFEDLWEGALKERPNHFYHLYSFLLVSLDPVPPKDSKELLKDIASRGFDLSNEALPFYLISNFGKQRIIDEISELIDTGLTKDTKINLEGVRYFVGHNSASLVDKLHYFEWVEVIEGENFEPIA